MVTFLSGGTGTPKLLWGLESVFDPATVTVVANTGDDVEIGGLHVSPDVDSVLFERSNRMDRETWWGIEGDTTVTNDGLATLAAEMSIDSEPVYLSAERQIAGPRLGQWRRFRGVPEFMTLGDRDRAVHIARTARLQAGESLTTVTAALAHAFDIEATVLPMSDDPVATLIHTPTGVQHFQAFWVARAGEPPVDDVEFRGAETATPAPGVTQALSEPVIVGPANPVTSLGPLVAIDAIEESLHSVPVVAVSPFVGRTAFSGPAGKLMRAVGADPSTRGMAAEQPWIDVFVVDDADDELPDRPVVRTDTKIETRADARRVLETCCEALDAYTSCSNLG